MFGGFGGGAPPGGGLDPSFDDFPTGLAPGRVPAVGGRLTGEIIEWKGRYGWIVPDAPINHPEARMKGGKLYLSQEDVLELISGVGAHVSFYVYADGNGLGALCCVPSDSATAKKKLTKAMAPKPKAKPKAATPGRTRISQELMHGSVKSWRGGFGFVTPASPVDHPLFTGSLFLHKADVDSPESVKEGRKVSFYMYRDPQGLGAEECTILDAEDGDDDVAAAASSADLLRAKPKASGPSSEGGLLVATPKAAGGMMRATPKASAAVKATGDSFLAKKMAENPELAKQLSAWMFDPGG